MRSFEEIEAIAVERHGIDGLAKFRQKPLSKRKLSAIAGDRWLSCMSKCIFQAGFNWKVVEAKWPDFEEVFSGFDLSACAMLHDEEIERLTSDTRIIRNGQKITTIPHNARFLLDLANEAGSCGAFFANWPSDDYVGLLDVLKTRGARLGGATAQYFLRFMGVDSFIFSQDVTKRLIAEGVIDKPPTSKTALKKAQVAINQWRDESGLSLTEISRTLACSID